MILICFVSAGFLAQISALDAPCEGKSPGEECLFDEECHGVNTICKNRKCVCPIGFELFSLGEDTSVCRPAPDKIGAECQSECKPPLLCRGGKCECWQGQVDRAGKCIVSCPAGQQLVAQDCTFVSKFGGNCQKDSECIDAFNVCRQGKCTCAVGTTPTSHRVAPLPRRSSLLRHEIRCVAVCPSGFRASQSCRRLFFNDKDILQHKSQSDSCPVGYQCVTYGKPNIGHCCPFYCPYGTVDSRRTCDPGAPLNQKCRSLTHFCHFQSGPGWKVSICCPKPCRDPTPLFINGRCLPLAHLEDPCVADSQCEGGSAMVCNVKGIRH